MKLLDKTYIETRLRDIPEIKKGLVIVDIEKSDRPYSKTLYLHFGVKAVFGYLYEQTRVRISDHANENSNCKNFIVQPNDILTKKRKDAFMKVLGYSCKIALSKNLKRNLAKLSKGE